MPGSSRLSGLSNRNRVSIDPVEVDTVTPGATSWPTAWYSRPFSSVRVAASSSFRRRFPSLMSSSTLRKRDEGSYMSTSIGSSWVTVAMASACPAVTRSPTDAADTLAMPDRGLVTVVQPSSACASVRSASADCSAAVAWSSAAWACSTWAWVVPDPSSCWVRSKDDCDCVTWARAEATCASALARFA